MECVQGALKNSFIPNNYQQHSLSDDFSPVNVLPSDDFFVDGLLDFSDDGDFEEEKEDTNVVSDTVTDKPIFVAPVVTENNDCFTIPVDDVADLEWVSQFVDDSFSSGYSLTCPAGKFPEKKPEPKPEPETGLFVKPSFTTPVQTKARSKRFRTGGRVWSLGSNALTESTTSSSSSSSCTSNPWLFLHDSLSNQTAESFLGRKPVKRQKRTLTGPVEPVQPRRCSHCGVQKTPQWRTGPLGAKTLCNACGVRFKSGRLLPEYRPACSPTFSSEVHSNNHRKVLEMRMKKEACRKTVKPLKSVKFMSLGGGDNVVRKRKMLVSIESSEPLDYDLTVGNDDKWFGRHEDWRGLFTSFHALFYRRLGKWYTRGVIQVSVSTYLSLSSKMANKHSIMTREMVESFCNSYYIPDEVHPTAPRRDRTITQFLEGKVGVYTRLFDYCGYRIPLTKFFVSVLKYFRIHISQLSPFGAAHISHFEVLTRVLDLGPSVAVFRTFYTRVYSDGLFSFAKRSLLAPSCLSKPPDSIKNWADHFFWVDSRVFPISVPLYTRGVLEKDLAPHLTARQEQAVQVLSSNKAPFRRYPECVLALVGLSLYYPFGENTYPAFERPDRTGG
ncbi:GATA transcription factor 5-like protein [Tanacetum coccineum]